MKSEEKSQGDLAELEFLLKAVSMGFIVSKPYGDNSSYDFILDNKTNLLKIQVKSTSYRQVIPSKGIDAYSVVAGYGTSGKKPYSKNQIDYIAAKIVPEDIWYIVPVEALTGHMKLHLRPHKQSSGKYEKYKENWQQLFS